MNSFTLFYLFFGITLSIIIIGELNKRNITGNKLLDLMEDDEAKMYIYDHPNTFKILMLFVFILIVLVWPIVICYLKSFFDNFEK